MPLYTEKQKREIDGQVCGECMYSVRNEDDDWVCNNPESDYYIDYVDYHDSCDSFSPRGIEQ